MAALLFALASPGRVTALCLAEQYRLARQPGFLDATLATLRDQVGPTGQRRMLLDRLGALRMPVLLVWGDQDRVVPVAQARRAAARLPDADMVVLSGCGHLPHVEDPAAFARADQSVARSAPRRRRRRAAAPAIR